MTHYVICPYSKPEYRDNLLQALERQTFRDFKAVVVENGPALGTFPQLDGVMVLQSDTHQSHAKNKALNWIRQQGNASWSCFDCDDYYGPDYLKSQIEALAQGDLVGKSFGNMLYVSYEDGLYLHCVGTLNRNNALTGGAMTCRTAHVPDFPIMPVGEDGHWSWTMQTKHKATVFPTGPRHYCYNRKGTGHTWDIGQVEQGIKNTMRSLGDLPLEVVSLPPRLVLSQQENVAKVLMLFTPDYVPARVSVPDVRRYCEIWDYSLTVYEDKIVPEWPAAWGKILATRKALDEIPEDEWVAWMDADMLFRRFNQTLESLIRPDKDLMISMDLKGLCTGFYVIRNTPLMKQFLDDLLKDVRMEWPWEQDAMKDLLESRPDYQERVGYIPEALVANPASGRSSRALIMHYWANGHSDRESLLQTMRRDIFYRDTGRSRGRMFG